MCFGIFYNNYFERKIYTHKSYVTWIRISLDNFHYLKMVNKFTGCLHTIGVSKGDCSKLYIYICTDKSSLVGDLRWPEGLQPADEHHEEILKKKVLFAENRRGSSMFRGVVKHFQTK